ncbi:hypothetical protein DM01DRAFT_1325048 [Hesseltinella vesiculosa]|uniref:Glycosyltransferase 2-like domain-containing protein n=1 Tax=Hesseltinella vesiculosa TaxID=101127 RepID=A0A1X2GCL9_9FUNG|nr:hypothetical protein DM01DRAFT_1325048 [Hesseltinella vesiculosa]
MDRFKHVHNQSHLLSTTTFDCAGCPRPHTAPFSRHQLTQACLDPGQLPEYYLSIIFVTRNDAYVGDQRQRLQNTIDSTFLMAERTRTLIELLIVEWNPEPQRRSIADSYRQVFRRSDYLTYRVISVPKHIHDALHAVARAPVYEYEGKNLGIRHARGQFICTTSQDDIWTPNMHNAIISRSWRKNTVYTQFQDPHHGEARAPTLVDLASFPTDDKLLHACSHHHKFPLGAFKMAMPTKLDSANHQSIAQHASDFTLAHRDTWQLTRGYREVGARTRVDMEFIWTAAWSLQLPVVHDPSVTFACHQDHPTSPTDPGHDRVEADAIQNGSTTNQNLEDAWGLQWPHLNDGLQCRVFRGGLGIS